MLSTLRCVAVAGGAAAAMLITIGWASHGSLEGSRRFSPGPGAGKPWPGGIITLHNAALAYSDGLSRAVRAWNTSGARLRFRYASAANAQVLIELAQPSACDGHAAACANLGYTGQRSHVWIVQQLDRDDAASVLAHELGHIVGLGHVKGCVAMNPRRWESCSPPPAGMWRCRLLEAGDVERAVALYGGAGRRLQGRVYCPRGGDDT